MSLITRLVHPSSTEVKLPVHQFMAALAEYKRGAPGIDLDAIAAAFNLSAAEKNQLQNFLTNLDGDIIDRHLIHDVLMMGESPKQDGSGDHYYSVANVKSRLGIT